ncbi:hypothetical protein VTI74DRAFT_1807 [Chaetomium olivicolor]
MTTFHPFPRLPFELRARIWELTVEPRTVEVRVLHKRTLVPDGAPSGEGRIEVRAPCLFSSTPVPAALHSCREARNLGLYQQAFSELSIYETRYVWLNLEIDMISIGTCAFDAFKPVAHLIRRLKFERRYGDEGFYYFEATNIRSFVNAKEIHVVCPDGIESWHEASKENYFPCGAENLFFIDLNDGRMMRSIELDEMCDQVLVEAWAAQGYDYFTGEPLSQERGTIRVSTPDPLPTSATP